jgi:myo-inositol 2-dehydrogenase/D-chiro-inositol 1-dehydrogenase
MSRGWVSQLRKGVIELAVLAALRRGEGPPVHASAGRRALLLALAAIESFRGGKRVSVETDSFREAAAPPIPPPPPGP